MGDDMMRVKITLNFGWIEADVQKEKDKNIFHKGLNWFFT